MPLCHPIKAIFIHVPRCAGTSINQFLIQNGYMGECKKLDVGKANFEIMYGIYRQGKNRYELDHATTSVFDLFVGEFFLMTYFKFAVVRNPLARLFSEYKRIVVRRDARLIDATKLTFSEFVERLFDLYKKGEFAKSDHFAINHYIPQNHFVFREDGSPFADYVGKYENLENDWKEICKKLSVPVKELPCLFSINQKNFNNHLNKDISKCCEITLEAKEMIYEIYKKDFQIFNYDPNLD